MTPEYIFVLHDALSAIIIGLVADSSVISMQNMVKREVIFIVT